MEHAICSRREESNGDLPLSNSRPSNMLISRLTWDNMLTNSAELFGRVDTPWNVFLSGFIGAGDTFRGGQNDEDFNLTNPPPARAYNNTFSTNDGHIGYAVVDLGYDLARNANYKIGPFVGYTYFNQDIFKFGCQQIANSIGNCIAGGGSAPIASSQLIGSEDMTWQGLRVGLSGQVKLADRVKLTADAAFHSVCCLHLAGRPLGQGRAVQSVSAMGSARKPRPCCPTMSQNSLGSALARAIGRCGRLPLRSRTSPGTQCGRTATPSSWPALLSKRATDLFQTTLSRARQASLPGPPS